MKPQVKDQRLRRVILSPEGAKDLLKKFFGASRLRMTFVLLSFLTMTCGFLIGKAFADTIYFKDGTTEKGLIVEEYYDRFVFSTADGEKELMKPGIDEIFFDEPYQNNVYLGKRFEGAGDFEMALQFYQLALQSNPDFKEARAAVKGLEDAKWHFKKSWPYKELKETLKSQLGFTIKQLREKIAVDKVYGPEPDTLRAGDVLISCWARPLTYAGLKNSSKVLIGLSNTILSLTIERDIKLAARHGLKLFSPITIGMEWEGAIVKSVDKDSPPYGAGLRQGDLIVKINGESVRYTGLDKLKRKIFHGSKDRVITVRREMTLMRKRSVEPKAMWVWNSKEILLNEAKKREFMDFCGEKNVNVLFFQLQYRFLGGVKESGQFSKGELSPLVVCRLLYETRLAAFLKEAHSRGMTVQALDGSTAFCLEGEHDLVLAQIKAILDFNKRNLPQERFDGVRYDNEPYLLAGFHSSMKEDIIRQYLELIQKCREFINASGAKLEFGVDMPFWFDQLDRLDAKLIDICDNIGIMDYRNFADGPDGIVAHALDKLKYAAGAKKKVFIGVETSKYPKQEVYFVSAMDQGDFNKRMLNKETADLVDRDRFEGFHLRVYSYETKVYIGLVKAQGGAEEDFKRALNKLNALFEKIPRPEAKETLDNLTFDAISALETNPEFRDIQCQEYSDEEGKPFLMFIAKEAMLEKITFADLREEDLNNVLAEAGKGFESYPSFAGFAIHHYKSYKELCEKK